MMQCCVISIRKSLRSWTTHNGLRQGFQAPHPSWQCLDKTTLKPMMSYARPPDWAWEHPTIPWQNKCVKLRLSLILILSSVVTIIHWQHVVTLWLPSWRSQNSMCCSVSFFQGPKVQTADINGTSCTCHVANLQAMAESSYSVDVHHECCQGCTSCFPPVLPSAWCYLSQQIHSTATQRIRFHHACWTPAAAMALINYLPPFANEEDSWMSWKCWRFPNYTRMFLDLFLDNPSG